MIIIIISSESVLSLSGLRGGFSRFQTDGTVL